MVCDKVPFFSVIVPVYNAQKFLEQCVDSILEQTYTDFELILVDDGSKDNSAAICDRYAASDSRVKVIHKENGGSTSARKEGCRNCCGDYVVCVDSDDWVAVDYLEKIHDACSCDPDVVCTGSVWWTDEEDFSNYWMPLPEGLYDRQAVEELIFPNLIENRYCDSFLNTLWSKAFKRELIVPFQLAVNPDIKMGDDLVVVKPALYRAQKVYIMDSYLYDYRINPNSMTRTYSTYNWRNPYLVGKALEAQIPMGEFDFQDQLYRNVVHGVFNVAVTRFYQQKQVKEIYAEIKKEISLSYYKNAIKMVKYAFLSKGWLAAFALKHKLFFLIKIFSRIKR